MTAGRVEMALKVLAEAAPSEVAESMILLGCLDPGAATRAEAAIRLLSADESDVPFWRTVFAGHQRGGR